MFSDRALRVLFRISVVGLSLVLLAYAALFALLAWPDPLFRHARGGGLVTFHSTAPLPPEAVALGEEVTAAFVASPLGLPAHESMSGWWTRAGACGSSSREAPAPRA
jgi:hypothetical protein